MAENKQTKKTFKYGDNEYLLDDLLRLHAAQEYNYYDFAKNRGKYDEQALEGLRESIQNRLRAFKEGRIFEGDGTLEGDQVDNVPVKIKNRGVFKKAQYTKQDNTEWAKHYFNKLIEQLDPQTKSSDVSTWDSAKHGLGAYLTGQGYNAKDIFEQYDLRDETNPDAARSYDQRRKLLKDQLTGYKTWLEGKGFDFTKNTNEWDDNFMSDLNDLINNFDNLDTKDLTSRLRKLEAGDNYVTAFTSDKWDLSKSTAELDQERKQKKAAEAEKLKKQYMDEYEDYAYNSRKESNPIYYAPFDYSAHNFDGKAANFRNWYADLNPEEQKAYGTYLGTDNQAWSNAWTSYINSLHNGSTYADKNLGILLQGTFETQGHQFVDLGDGNYLIKDSVTDDGQGIVYNPKSGYTDKIFLGDFANSNAAVKDIYKQLAYKYINQKYGTNYEDRPDVFKEGGELIPKNQYGSKVVYNWETTDDSVKPKAEKNNVSITTQKAKDQYLDSDNQSIDNPNAGWDAKHYARLGSAVADLGAAVAGFVPGYGTAASAVLGVGSTVTNFFTDMSDDAVTAGEMWKNLGLNLGMDVLGLIPGGGAASKMGKILKTLKGTVPLIIALPGVASMLSHSPEIAASWKKAFDGDPENGGSKMDYQDYMNILQVLNVAAGATNIARNTYKSSKVSTKHADKLAVDVIDTSTKQRRALVLEGDDVTKFKEANAKGEAQNFVDSIEGPGKFTINEITTSNKGKFWGTDENGNFKLFKQNPLGTSATGQANTLEIKFDNKKGKLYAETGRWDADLMDSSLIDASATRRYNTEIGRLQGDLDTVTGKMKQSMSARTKRRQKVKAELTPEKARLVDLQNKLRGVPDTSTLQSNKAQLEADLATLEQQIVTRQQAVAAAEADLQKLEATQGVPAADQAAHKAAIRSARSKVKRHKTTLQGYESDKQRHLTGIAAIDQQLQMQAELPIAQAKVSRLEGILNQLNPSTHTHAYNKLQQMVADYQTNHSTIEGRTVKWDMNEILKNAGIRNAFKRGGSIDRNKINKFLNYAKG